MRKRAVRQRRRIFLGVEGECERTFAKWLEIICNGADCNIHIDTRVSDGGDTFAITEFSIRELRTKTNQHGRYEAAMILLDRDRFESDRNAGRNPEKIAKHNRLELIWQNPNLERLLIRLHPGKEQTNTSPQSVQKNIRKLWPDYSKKFTVEQLVSRFSIDDLKRVAKYDESIRKLLDALNLRY